MSMARKRKSSSPEPRVSHFKSSKKEESVFDPQAAHIAPLDPEICTPIKGKCQGLVSDTSSSGRRSARYQTPCGVESEYHSNSTQCLTLSEDDTELGLVITLDENLCRGQGKRIKKGMKMKQRVACVGKEAPVLTGVEEEVGGQEEPEDDISGQLDRELERKSRQHNLSTANVRRILHEVITNEHVVAMMKAAIRETQDMPMFVIPSWNISPIKKSSEVKPPQFVDILLEEEEDSSDEEYCPDEDEEDETAEETFLESDVESIASSPRGSQAGRSRTPVDSSESERIRSSSPRQVSWQSRHLRVEAVPMGPPPAPQSIGPPRPPRAPPECTFMEKLHAVEEELALSPVCMEPYQTLSSAGEGEDSLVACRTRSKRPLRDIPLGKLEAELRAPDITPDMYDCGSAPEDKEWAQWLQGLMSSDMENEEEGDDDDDPEYNFLEDIDEPDVEDYRNDRAVRITKKEVNELMEELFETFQDELGMQEQDDEAHEEEEEKEEEFPPPGAPKFNVPQAIRFEEPLANMLTERHRAAKEQLEALQQRRSVTENQSKVSHSPPAPQVLLVPPPCPLILTVPQKLQLQQQIQQHVQLLTQVHMLSSSVKALESEASTTRHFLEELKLFAEQGEEARSPLQPGFISIFRACNLQGALSLLEELKHSPVSVLPAKPVRTNCVRSYPLLPQQLAWLMATRSVFMYPELLPHCSLDPALHPPRSKYIYTQGEECLIVLGLKHFNETELPYQLMCRYLIRTKNQEQVRGRVHNLCLRRAPDNMIKFYMQHKVVPQMPLACCRVKPGEERPPVEREDTLLPIWLRKSLPFIHEYVLKTDNHEGQISSENTPSASYIFPPGTQYPAFLPSDLTLRLHPSGFKSLNSQPGTKPQLLCSFRPPTLPSLVKTSPSPTDTAAYLGSSSAITPNPGVILLAKAPSTPIQGAVPLAQALLTPAHGAVPTNTALSVNLNSAAQYFGPKTVCTVLQDVPAAPSPSLLHVSTAASKSMAFLRQGAVKNIVQTTPIYIEKVNQKMFTQRLLPIQPASPSVPSQPLQLFTISSGATANMLNFSVETKGKTAGVQKTATEVREACNVVQPTVIINLAAPVDSTVASAESSSPPQDPVSSPNSPLAQLRKLARPLLPAPPNLGSPQNSPLKSLDGHVFLSQTLPFPLAASPEHETIPTKRLYSAAMTMSCETLKTKIIEKVQNGADPSSDKQHCTVRTSCGAGPQIMQTVQLGHHAPLNYSGGAHHCSSLVSSKTNPEESVTIRSLNVSNYKDIAQLPLNMKPCASSLDEQSSRQRLQYSVQRTEEWKEEEDHGGEEWGEEESGEVSGPFLALSESSSSPRSSLDSHADALERLMDVEENEVEEEWCHLTLTPYPNKTGEAGNEDTEAGSGKVVNEGQISGRERDGEEKKNGQWTGDEKNENCSSCVNVPQPEVTAQQRLTGMLTLASANEGQEKSGVGEAGGDGQTSGGQGNGEEGDQQDNNAGERQEGNGNGGSSGERGEDGEGGKKSGDGEQSGNREGNGKQEGSGEKDGDGERERQGGEEEEEEDFDDLTQDEDEEEVMSSASEESVLSVPELQETMEKLTWLASERRLCGEGDSEEDNSPNSPNSPTSPTSPVSQNSQEENSEEEEEGPPKGEEMESSESGRGKLPGDSVPQEADPPQANGKAAGRGRGKYWLQVFLFMFIGRGRPPPRSLKRSRRQERDSKDTSKLLLLYDDHILDNDPQRESKDIAFAQAYLNRVREALQDIPGKMEEFLGLLYEFDQGGEGRSAVELFGQLKPLLKDSPDLLRDFAAFLLPGQALECGLFAEQQAFERSRRFLRQLEISFGENPTHYQKIVRALQGGPDLSPAAIEELKAQMTSLLKGHTHLQGEFWVFFDELRPPPARPGQFEEAVWPEEGGAVTDGGDSGTVGPGGGSSGGFEEVTLPDLEEEEEVHKIPPMTARSRRRKELGTHGNDKECDCPEKDCSCPCHDAAHESKLRRHKRKGCPHCHSSKVSDSSRVMKSRDPLYPGSNSPLPEMNTEKREEREEGREREGEKEGGIDANSPHPDIGSWDGPQIDSVPHSEERDEEEDEEDDEWKEGEGEGSPVPKKCRRDREDGGECDEPSVLPSGERDISAVSAQPRSSTDPPVCAKNISLTPSGEKVILWTREADRVILTACQQQGANQNTFQAVSAQLGNKTANEVSRRFRDLMRLFHTAARQVSSEDEASNPEQQSATDEELD
ncbi:GON-4-like protein isoform X1 [Arapaima gigas]